MNQYTWDTMDCTYFQDSPKQYWIEQQIQDLSDHALESLKKKGLVDSVKQLEILASGRVNEEDTEWDIWEKAGLDIQHAYAVLGDETALERILLKDWSNYEPDYL